MVDSSHYQNPVLAGFYPDPSITRVGNDYYLVNSSFGYFPGLPIFHSNNLIDWQQISNAFNRQEQFSLQGVATSRGIFAPDISYHNGRYYLVSTCVECEGIAFNNFVMTAKSPEGPWSHPKRLKFSGIDPSIFWDSDGKAYIVHNDDPAGGSIYEGHKAIWLHHFDPNTLTVTGEPIQIINGGGNLAQKPFWVEGPHLFKKAGYYYLITALGGTQKNHSEVAFRAKQIEGPYQSDPYNPILTQRDIPQAVVANTGHADFVHSANGEWWSLFLGVRPYDDQGDFNTGRETFALPVQWKDGWPRIVNHGETLKLNHVKTPLNRQAASVSTANRQANHYQENFTHSKLGPQWLTIRNSEHRPYTIKDGQLILPSAGSFGDLQHQPAFVGVRQTSHTAMITTTMNDSLSSQNGDDEAGLVAIQNDQTYLFFGLIHSNHGRYLTLYQQNGNHRQILKSRAFKSPEPIKLQLAINAGHAQASYQVENSQHEFLKNIDMRFLSTTRAGGFTGTIIGLYHYHQPNSVQ